MKLEEVEVKSGEEDEVRNHEIIFIVWFVSGGRGLMALIGTTQRHMHMDLSDLVTTKLPPHLRGCTMIHLLFKPHHVY